MSDMLKEDDDIKDDDIVIVEDDPTVKNASEEDDEEDKDEEDERSAKSNDSNDDEREAIRERRRLEKLERKDRRDKAISRDKLELDFLRKRNDDLERRVSVQEQRSYQSDLSTIDGQIQKAKEEADMADRVIAKAVEAGNGQDVAQALRYRDEAMQRVQQLNASKYQASQRPAAVPQMDDMTLHFAQEFLNENKWYDSQGRDEDSAIVMAIDQSLAKDGYDPKTEDYWEELRRRSARRLPERFGNIKSPVKNEMREERQPRGGPAVGSGREHAPTSTRKEVYINPERKQALIDAGVWDDPVLRMKYVKRYTEYDRNNKA